MYTINVHLLIKNGHFTVYKYACILLFQKVITSLYSVLLYMDYYTAIQKHVHVHKYMYMHMHFSCLFIFTSTLCSIHPLPHFLSRPFPTEDSRDYYNDVHASGEDLYASLQDISA